MILCIGPNDKLQLSTDVATNIHAHISGMDVDGAGNVTTYRRNIVNTSWNGLADLTVAPASGTTRNIKTLNIKNSNTTSASVTATIIHTDGTTSVELFKTVIQAQQTLQYIEGVGWSLSQGIPASLELDYVQATADSAAISATTEATAVTVITGNSVVYDGATKVEIHFFSPGIFSSAANQVTVVLYRDGTPIGQSRGYGTAQSANTVIAWSGETFFVDTPPAGSHTYSVGAFVSANNSTFKAWPGGSGNYLPMFLRVTRAIGVTGPRGPAGGFAGFVAGRVAGATGNSLYGSGFTSSRTGTGLYTITLTTAQPNANYAVVCTPIAPPSNSGTAVVYGTPTTTVFTVATKDTSTANGAARDLDFSFMVYGA